MGENSSSVDLFDKRDKNDHGKVTEPLNNLGMDFISGIPPDHTEGKKKLDFIQVRDDIRAREVREETLYMHRRRKRGGQEGGVMPPQ